MACGLNGTYLQRYAYMSVMQGSAASIPPATYVGAYFALWVAVLMLLRTCEGFEASEALAALVVLGLIFPALAMLATRRVSALPHVVRQPGIETAVLVMYLGVIAWMLVWGFGRVAHIRAEPLHSVVLLGVKLVTFVGPAALMLALGHYRISELMPISLTWRDLRPALWMSLAALLMQSTLGRGLHDIREAHLLLWVLAVATPLSFAWFSRCAAIPSGAAHSSISPCDEDGRSRR